MRKSSFLIGILILATALFFISIFMLILSFVPLESHSLYASATISSEKGGFDVNSTALTFGIVRLGGSSTRAISVSNSHAFPLVMRISAKGSIEPHLAYAPVLRLEPYETQRISFSLVASPDTPPGFYDGEVSFRFYPTR